MIFVLACWGTQASIFIGFHVFSYSGVGFPGEGGAGQLDDLVRSGSIWRCLRRSGDSNGLLCRFSRARLL